MATTNVTINRTSYTEIAGIGATGRVTNLSEDSIYIVSSATQPNDADIGLLCVGINKTNNNIISLNGNPTDKIWARLANNALTSFGEVAVVVGEESASSGTSGGATLAEQETQTTLLRLGTAPVQKIPIAASITSVTLLAANPNRKRGSVFANNSASATLYLSLSSTATTAAPRILPPYSIYTMDDTDYKGIVTGIWSAAVGQCNVEEAL